MGHDTPCSLTPRAPNSPFAFISANPTRADDPGSAFSRIPRAALARDLDRIEAARTFLCAIFAVLPDARRGLTQRAIVLPRQTDAGKTMMAMGYGLCDLVFWPVTRYAGLVTIPLRPPRPFSAFSAFQDFRNPTSPLVTPHSVLKLPRHNHRSLTTDH